MIQGAMMATKTKLNTKGLIFSDPTGNSAILSPLMEAEVGLDGEKRKVLKLEGTAIVCDIPGINNRLYPSDIIGRESGKFKKNRILQGRSGSELNHPRIDKAGNGKDQSIYEINLERVCALIEKLDMRGNKLDIKARITKSANGNLTTAGDILANLIEHGMRPGCSLRGAGSGYDHPNGYTVVAEDYDMITVDIVGNPSFDKDAMLDVVYESATKGMIMMESVGNPANKAIIESATQEFLHQIDNGGMWHNSKELRSDALLRYLNRVTSI